MFSDRLKQFTRTLRFRLMLSNAFVVVLTAAVTLVGMQVGVRRALLHEMDQFLIDDVRDLSRSSAANRGTRAFGPSPRFPSTVQRPGHGRFVTIFDDKGEVLWASDNQPVLPQLAGALVDLKPSNVSDFRIVQQHAADARGTPLLIRIGFPLSVLDADIARVDSLAAVVACVVLAIAPVLGYGLAWRVTNVLSEIIGRTAGLRPARLDERLPIRGTGDELDQLASTVNGLLDRIASYLNRREDFLANAAHELRTPVAAIRSTAEVALGGKRTAEEYQEILADVVDECQFLELLVNQLLLLSESDSDRLRIHGERVALDEIVGRSAEMFGTVADSLGIALEVHTVPTIVEGNRHHLRQVFNNLLDNAVKFTPPGGSVHINMNEDPERRYATLNVSDTGIGIAAEHQPFIFERFYRCDKSRSHEGATRGTGLGLSICQAVVEAHGGTIRVESEPGRGTTFTVVLPQAGP